MSGVDLVHLMISAFQGGIESERVLELCIPGFRSISNFFSKWLRIDLAKITKFGFFCLLYVTVGRAWVSQVYEHFLGYFTSTVSIPADDRVNREVLAWMSDHISKRNVRFLAVQSENSAVKFGFSDYVSKSDRSALREA